MKLRLPRVSGMTSSVEMIERHGVDGEDTLVVGLTFRCNSRCRFCIIETEIDEGLPDADAEILEEVFRVNAAEKRFRRLTLTGAEVTLLPSLEEQARAATSRGAFEVVRIQTNGRALRHRDHLERLMAAGIREYFVSVHAHTPALDAHITRAPASFAQMQAGLDNAIALGARVITNTVVCASNAESLPDIARFIVDRGVRELQFWNFVEVGDVGQTEELAPIGKAVPRLLEALEVADAAGASVELKWFPRCLLGRFAERLDNHQPQLLIRDEFQDRMGRNFAFGCVHRDRCAHFGRGCDGLHERYVQVHGDERALLRPTFADASAGMRR